MRSNQPERRAMVQAAYQQVWGVSPGSFLDQLIAMLNPPGSPARTTVNKGHNYEGMAISQTDAAPRG
jgi:hypothetical protein